LAAGVKLLSIQAASGVLVAFYKAVLDILDA
jgi:hypothetical protein